MEVVEVEDLYTSPVPQKIMSSLRHSKSEENLGIGDATSLSALSMCSGICDEHDLDWSQEDDEISQQVGVPTLGPPGSRFDVEIFSVLQ